MVLLRTKVKKNSYDTSRSTIASSFLLVSDHWFCWKVGLTKGVPVLLPTPQVDPNTRHTTEFCVVKSILMGKENHPQTSVVLVLVEPEDPWYENLLVGIYVWFRVRFSCLETPN